MMRLYEGIYHAYVGKGRNKWLKEHVMPVVADSITEASRKLAKAMPKQEFQTVRLAAPKVIV